MGKRYTGWIPTVSGRLSYTIIGDSSHPTQAKYINYVEHKTRFIFSFQKRNLDDVPKIPFLRFFVDGRKGMSGDFYFVMHGKARDVAKDYDSVLEGRAYVFMKTRDVTERLNYLIKRFDDYQASVFISDCLEPNLLDIFKSSGLYCLDYTLHREGDIEFSYPNAPFEKSMFKKLKDFDCNDELELHIAGEVFFFMRDLCHRHQHHHPQTDTLVDLYETTNDNVGWINETLRGLYKSILEYKRINHFDTRSACLGVLQYAKTFRSIVTDKKKTRFPNDDGELRILDYQDENIINSISVANEKEFYQVSIRKGKSASAISYTGLLAAIFASVFALFSLSDSKEFELSSDESFFLIVKDVVQYFYSNPEVYFSIFFMSYFFVKHRDYEFTRSSRFVRELTKIFMSRSKFFGVTLTFLPPLIFFLGIFWFVVYELN